MKVGPWQMTDDKCGAFRAYEGKDGNILANRVAFIEKTPRIRIRDARVTDDLTKGVLTGDYDYLNWAPRPWKGEGPKDTNARKWCDEALKLFGYTL